MAAIIRRTPLELPRTTLFRPRYDAVLLDDGSLLPIEERLGKRLLRTLPAECREARGLLSRGEVRLRRADGRRLCDTSLEAALSTLSRAAAARLERLPGGDGSRRTCRQALLAIERRRRALRRDH